jgi:hypothetical protein
MGILPPRPLPLAEQVLTARRRKALLLAALFVAFGAGFGAGTGWFFREALRERTVWQNGEEGQLLELGGKVETTSKFGIEFFYDYHLDVVYASASGTPRSAKVEFGTVWKPIDDKAPARIRYLAADPEHPTLSWAIDAGLSRWGMPLLMAGLTLMFLLAAMSTPRLQARAQASLRAAAEDGEELLFPLLSVASHKGTWTVRYEPAPGTKATLSGPDAPLVVEHDGRKHVVTLRSPRATTVVLVPGDLAVFAFDAATRDEIWRRSGG